LSNDELRARATSVSAAINTLTSAYRQQTQPIEESEWQELTTKLHMLTNREAQTKQWLRQTASQTTQDFEREVPFLRALDTDLGPKCILIRDEILRRLSPTNTPTFMHSAFNAPPSVSRMQFMAEALDSLSSALSKATNSPGPGTSQP
jgi:hypothetical protein